jgi:hypothetical protein
MNISQYVTILWIYLNMSTYYEYISICYHPMNISQYVNILWIYLNNVTFNNISIISWCSVLLVEETGGLGENNQPVASHWQTLSHNVVHLALIEIRTRLTGVSMKRRYQISNILTCIQQCTRHIHSYLHC